MSHERNNGTSESGRLSAAERLEAADPAAFTSLDRALSGAFAGHPFDDRLAAKISSAVRARGAAPLQRGHAGAEATGGRILRAPSKAPAARPLLSYAFAAALLAAGGLAVALLSRGPETPAGGGIADGVRVASITSLPGDGARLLRSGGDGYVPEGQTLALRAGDRLRAERRQLTVALEGGGELQLRPDTTIELRKNGVAIVDGPGVIAVAFAPESTSHKGFRVETPDGIAAEVVGTRFGVRFDGARTVTTVLDGSVVVAMRDTPERIHVGAGRELSVRRGSTFVESAPANLARDLGWTLWKEALAAAPASTPAPSTGLVPPAAPAGKPEGASTSAGPSTAPAKPAGSFLPLGSPEPNPRTHTSGDMPIGAPGKDGDE